MNKKKRKRQMWDVPSGRCDNKYIMPKINGEILRNIIR